MAAHGAPVHEKPALGRSRVLRLFKASRQRDLPHAADHASPRLSLLVSHWSVPFALQGNIVQEFADVLPDVCFGYLSRTTPATEFSHSLVRLFQDVKRSGPFVTVSLGANGIDSSKCPASFDVDDVRDSRSRLEHLGIDACWQWATEGEFPWNSIPHDECVVREAIELVDEWEHDARGEGVSLLLHVSLLSCRDTFRMQSSSPSAARSLQHASTRIDALLPSLRELITRVSDAGFGVAMFCLHSFATGEHASHGNSPFADGTTSFFCANRALADAPRDLPVDYPLPRASVDSLVRRFARGITFWGDELSERDSLRHLTHELRADGTLRRVRGLCYDEDGCRLFACLYEANIFFDLTTDPEELRPLEKKNIPAAVSETLFAAGDRASASAPTPPLPNPSPAPLPSAELDQPSPRAQATTAKGKESQIVRADEQDTATPVSDAAKRAAKTLTIRAREKKMHALHRT